MYSMNDYSFGSFGGLCSGVQKQLAAASTTRRILAQTLLTISLAYMDFRRKQQVSNFFPFNNGTFDIHTVSQQCQVQSPDNQK
jgi:hypothetical protein